MECTKAALGLRLFLALAAEGEAALARYVEDRTDLAAVAAERIRRRPEFELAIAPESNIVCFRTRGSDDQQLEIRRRLLEGGEQYITTTEFRGRRWLRITLMSPATTLEDVGTAAGRHPGAGLLKAARFTRPGRPAPPGR